MTFAILDQTIIIAFFVISLVIGLYSSRASGKDFNSFFLSKRSMPWWLLGVSMVATTFSADTPNLVTNIVRTQGVSGNWVWWAFLLTGMTTVFIYAKLWRRSGLTTDIAFYELRYSGPEAQFLRGFRAIYLGVFFNVMIMASVLLAGIKISAIMIGINAWQTVLLIGLVTLSYSVLGGLRGVILTDFFQFFLSMAGMIAAAIYIVGLPEIGGLENLISMPEVISKKNLIPDLNDKSLVIQLLLIPLAVQWWSAWYPGAEPGGGGYIAQRMLSAKTENDAIFATLLFNVAHYALRPWPWILIALASLVIFPSTESIQDAFPAIDQSVLDDDIAFPAMLILLPSGLLGLCIASLIAALMSTLSTHLNWGASYVVHDFYVRFIKPDASEKVKVSLGRISTLALMFLSGLLALFLESALDAFNILLQIGAGTGLIYLLRWFWWRINAFSEIAAMMSSFLVAFYFELIEPENWLHYQEMLANILITTAVWLVVTFITPPTRRSTLENFYRKIQPHAFGWRRIAQSISVEDHADLDQNTFAHELWLCFWSCIFVYAVLFTTGYILYGDYFYFLIGLLPLLSSLFILIIGIRSYIKRKAS